MNEHDVLNATKHKEGIHSTLVILRIIKDDWTLILQFFSRLILTKILTRTWVWLFRFFFSYDIPRITKINFRLFWLFVIQTRGQVNSNPGAKPGTRILDSEPMSKARSKDESVRFFYLLPIVQSLYEMTRLNHQLRYLESRWRHRTSYLY